MDGRYGMSLRWWDGKLRKHSCRITVPRQAILDVLSKEEKHLSAEDIFLKVYRVYPGIGLTTVYRTLNLLTQIGLVLKFDFGDGRARFELVGEPKKEVHHHHLICTSCNRIIDYADFIDEEVKLFKKTEKFLSKKYKFEINNHLVNFYGLCEKCRSEL
ncbi:MAG: Fur family transcriptional regulator [candidate division WOR-3 bacterium]